MQIPNQIIERLKTSQNVFLASHVNPDGDAIGSLIALGSILGELGKHTLWYNDSPLPAVYRFLPSVDEITRKVADLSLFDTAIVMDCGDIQRIGDLAPEVEKLPVVINIDHHTTNSRFGHMRIVDTAACATAEIVYRIGKRLGVAISKAMATAIYTGILTDTGSFRFSNTTQTTFTICDEMVKAGVSPHDVAGHVYGEYSLGRIKLLNLALNTLEISENGKLSLMTVTKRMLEETRTKPEDADGLINYAKGIRDVRLAVLILENNNGGPPPPKGERRLHVSLRSDGSVDVALIAALYGGGGHASASGFTLDGRYSELRSQILELAETI